MVISAIGAKYRDRNTIDPLRANAAAVARVPTVTGASGGLALIDPATTSGVQPVGQTGYTLVMSEEFGGSITVTDAPNGYLKFRSNGPRWQGWYADQLYTGANTHTNNPGTELEYYDLSGISMAAPSSLVLTCVKDNVHAGLPYTSGMCTTAGAWSYQYGYIEASCQVDGLQGDWPAFWTIPQSYSWPPEIDVFENFGWIDHFTVSNWTNGGTVKQFGVDRDLSNGYHVYGMKWTSTQIKWYFDGVLLTTENSAIPQELMYPVFNMAVNDSTVLTTGVFKVDYFRAWQ